MGGGGDEVGVGGGVFGGGGGVGVVEGLWVLLRRWCLCGSGRRGWGDAGSVLRMDMAGMLGVLVERRGEQAGGWW